MNRPGLTNSQAGESD